MFYCFATLYVLSNGCFFLNIIYLFLNLFLEGCGKMSDECQTSRVSLTSLASMFGRISSFRMNFPVAVEMVKSPLFMLSFHLITLPFRYSDVCLQKTSECCRLLQSMNHSSFKKNNKNIYINIYTSRCVCHCSSTDTLNNVKSAKS